MEETYRPLFHEIFTKVNNAKDKPKKIKVLQAYRTEALEMFLKSAFFHIFGVFRHEKDQF